jgi:hypothetical protein
MPGPPESGVQIRPQEPHSLRHQECPRDGVPLSERDSQLITEMGTTCQSKCDDVPSLLLILRCPRAARASKDAGRSAAASPSEARRIAAKCTPAALKNAPSTSW